MIISPTEIFFQPNIQADKEVAASHFLDFQFGGSGSTVAPGDGHGGPRKSPNNGLERQLDRQVEVRRNQRPATVDDFTPISLEGVGGVIELDPKQNTDERIGQPIQ